METITLKKYRGRGNNYLILDPNKMTSTYRSVISKCSVREILEAMQSVYCMDRS